MLVLIPKRPVVSFVHDELSSLFPHETLTYLVVNPFGMPYVYDYPKDLSWSEYPFWSPAQYRLEPTQQFQVVLKDGEPVRNPVDYATLPPQSVISLPDPNRTSVLAAQRMVDHLNTLGLCTRFEGHCLIRSYKDDTLAHWFSQRVGNAQLEGTLQAGRLKADFEYSFLVNASGVLTRAYRAAGGAALNPVFSKYTIQVLYALRKRGATREGLFIHQLRNWTGTGRYPFTTWLTSVNSSEQIFETLHELGLIERSNGGKGRGCVSATSLGLAFLDRLHPDCEDPDLPFRMEEWMKDPVSGELKAQRYLRTWFGKQKRFSPKNAEA